MNEIKKSPIQIVEFTIRELKFKVNSPALRAIEVPIEAINLNVSVQANDELHYSSLCGIEINSQNENESDFTLSATYQIDACIADIQSKESLERFAKFGAPFNMLTHVRELLILLSTRAFGRAVSIPLLDITELGKLITIKSAAKQADEQFPSLDKEPTAQDKK